MLGGEKARSALKSRLGSVVLKLGSFKNSLAVRASLYDLTQKAGPTEILPFPFLADVSYSPITLREDKVELIFVQVPSMVPMS